MLFVTSAAVRFHSKPVIECALKTVPRLQSRVKALTQELRQLEPKDIKKQLHVNDALAKQYALHLGNFEGVTPLQCCALYDNKLFNALGGGSWQEEDAKWANNYVRILSGLYGWLRPYDEIQPLGLPVSLGTKLINSKGKFLRDFWLERVHQELYEDLLDLPMPVIVNMASEEDTVRLFDKDGLPDGTRIATVEFKTVRKEDAGIAQGEFLRWALESRIMTVEELLDFKGLRCGPEDEAAVYRMSPSKSSADHLVFEEATGQGADGGWQKKFNEYDGSKTKFIKEASSGKQRYLRGEIKKALEKDQRRSRKNASVY